MFIAMTLIMTQISLAVISDLYTHKVKNQITFTFIILAIIYNLIFFGLQSLSAAILGLAVPLIILMPLYALRMLGAGDIKLFCSLGALVGLRIIVNIILYSFISGAFIAIALILIRKNSKQRLLYLVTYIKSCFICMKLMPYGEMTGNADGGKMHFTIPIAVGTILAFMF